MKRVLLVVLAISLCGVEARACLNDRELKAHEREFRASSRIDLSSWLRSREKQGISRDDLIRYAMLSGGLILLVGSVVATIRSSERGPKEIL